MLLNAIIIDDEPKGISSLKLLIEKLVSDVRVIAESTKAVEGLPLIEHYKPEIVFLDINMPGMNGFELLEQLHWKNFNLIFTTAHEEYGLKAIKNNAVDYLLKPVSSEELKQSIERVRRRLAENMVMVKFNYTDLANALKLVQKNRMAVISGPDMEYLNVPEIVYLESQSNYTKIYIANSRQVITRKTLKEFEIQLCYPDSDFMRVHNSYIINLKRTLRYTKDEDCIVLSNYQKIPLSKSRKEIFFRWLGV